MATGVMWALYNMILSTLLDNPQGTPYSPAEKRLFWIGLIANVAAWVGVAILEIFRLKFGEDLRSVSFSICLRTDERCNVSCRLSDHSDHWPHYGEQQCCGVF